MLIFNRCISGLMSDLIKKSWTVSTFHVVFTRDFFGFGVEVLWGYLGFLSVSNIDLTVGHIVLKR